MYCTCATLSCEPGSVRLPEPGLHLYVFLCDAPGAQFVVPDGGGDKVDNAIVDFIPQ
jgi:hypothetical protein